MGTKNNPGLNDCYAKADPDEPIFTLRAKDPAAAETIRFWIAERSRLGILDSAKSMEAGDCALAMETWYEENISG